MKKTLVFFLAILTVFALVSCDAAGSSYSATMLKKATTSDHCEVEFATLKGTLKLNASPRAVHPDGTIDYEAELLEGEIHVYYETDGNKELLFSIKGGERIESRGGSIRAGERITIIIETVGTAKQGDIDIEFN